MSSNRPSWCIAIGLNPLHRTRVERPVKRTRRIPNGWRVHHGDAPMIVSFPHTGTEIPAGYRSAPRLALARAQGRGLLGGRAVRLRARRGRHHHPHGPVAHRDRRESRSVGCVAVSGPGHHGSVPDGNLRRRAALQTGHANRTPPRSSSASATTSRPITQRSPPRSERLRARHGRVVLYDAHSIRSRVPATVRRDTCRSSTSAPTTARAATRR